MSFDALGLNDALLKNISEQGYDRPSEIQQAAIPVVLQRHDVLAIAQTGTGKTAGFSLPLIQLLHGGKHAPAKHIRALIITPTRELAAQVAQSVKNYTKDINITSAAVFGGVRIEPQIAALAEGVDILIATPGRLLDLHSQGALHFSQLEMLVLDEADRMLDLGFIDEISEINRLLPQKRQTLMFSATFTEQIKNLAGGMLCESKKIEIKAANSTVDKIEQRVYHVDKKQKPDVLRHLIKQKKWSHVLVFCRTKQGADTLVTQLNAANINADSIHANRTQHARTQALEGFKTGAICVLVATDIAARGIDIDSLPCVVNFDLPYVPEDYVHRIGRTGRAGRQGVAITLFSSDESKQLKAIENLIRQPFERELIPQFVPSIVRAEQMWGGANTKKHVKRKSTKTKSKQFDDDEYGNFEAMPTAKDKNKAKKRKRR